MRLVLPLRIAALPSAPLLVTLLCGALLAGCASPPTGGRTPAAPRTTYYPPLTPSQSDDIAILTLKVQPEQTEGTEDSTAKSRLTPLPPVQNPARASLELHATPEEVMRGVEALQEFAAAQGVPEKIIFGLALALEECGSNIVNHALQRDAQKKFQVLLERAGDSFVLELRDDGPAFDPTAAAAKKPQAEDDDLPGGWGIELVRRQMDEVSYRREGAENVLRLRKQLVSGGPAA